MERLPATPTHKHIHTQARTQAMARQSRITDARKVCDLRPLKQLGETLSKLGPSGEPDDLLLGKVVAMTGIPSLPIEAIASFQDVFQQLA